MEIRRASPEDARVLGDIRREAILKLAPRTMGLAGAREWANAAAADRMIRAIEENEVWVAELSGTPVGWVEVANDRIEGAYISPHLASNGIGSALLAHVEACIHDAGYCAVRLDASLYAVNFYRNRGYKPLADQRVKSALSMAKNLTEPAPTLPLGKEHPE